MSSIDQVHITHEALEAEELTPPHPPRTETPIYTKSHHHLIYELDTPCRVCGVKHSTLGDPLENLYGATAMETHHYPIERSLLDACDWRKISAKFPAVQSLTDVEAWVDTEENLIVLCDQHHRGRVGIHRLSTADWVIQEYLLTGYVVATDKAHEVSDEQHDAAIVTKEEA